MADEALDSAIEWVADHTRRYVETGGADGHLWKGIDGSLEEGVPCLILTTTGRRSGKLRRNALIYFEDGDDYILVASRGGAPKNPLWYENLVADANVTIQVADKVMTGTARTVSSDEEAQLWSKALEVWPPYEEYQAKTDRDIPVIRVTTS